LRLRSRPREQRDEDECCSWVVAAVDGDRAAFGHLYKRFAPMVHGILLARVPFQEVDDLVQEVFVAALGSLQSLRDHHRVDRQVLELPPDLGSPDGGNQAELREILGVVRRLPEAYRETLVLRFVEGMTGPEIANRTGLAPDSVRVNLHRGVKLLRKNLGLGGDK